MNFKWQVVRWVLRVLATIAGVAPGFSANAQATRLQAFNVDIQQTSVSGLSSGGYMAVQFEVANSTVVKGAGIIAGGPYFCAQGSVSTATAVCSCTTFAPLCRTADGATDVTALAQATERFARNGDIDAPANLARHRVYLFSGALDSKVPPPVMRDLASYYRKFMPAANLHFVGNVKANHAMPTLSFGNPCSSSETPYIDRCRFDAAGQLMDWIYGPLQPARPGPLQGTFIEFDQSEFLASPTAHGLDNTGWLYVPQACQGGQPCRLHVAFHGCRQGQSFSPLTLPFAPIGAPYGRTFVDHAGYNRWADTNAIIVLYPQAVATFANPQGCWDWWGYDDANYAIKSGRQMAAIRAMVDRIASGHQ